MRVNQYYKKMKWLFFLLVFLPSYEKECCWDCVLTHDHRTPPLPCIITTTYPEYCDKAEKEINKMIQDNEYTHGMSSMSYMTCTKRQ
ncbi:MAG TPA: hypothetical protein VFD03_07965 [Clostridia bacterium]|nr:hypothetical protein [Clostridia bacterium]